ncbi:MAG: 3-deoxy-manno-octulosonate cytidylyltransferase [Gammaproteobacteria bacterium]
MTYKIIIPARLGSTRLPNKPLKDIGGKTLLQRVVEQAKKSNADSIYVATDSEEIVKHCAKIDVESVLTSKKHKTGSDRLAEACKILGIKEDLIINVQGDEPFIEPKDIDNLYNLLADLEANMATMYTDLDYEDREDTNVVKLWMNDGSSVKDFSRNIDYLNPAQAKKHLGVYGYRVNFLHSFVAWEQSHNELERNLEQMRAMDNKEVIYAIKSDGSIHLGIDTPEDLLKAREIIENR